jgi:hypothetical protein
MRWLFYARPTPQTSRVTMDYTDTPRAEPEASDAFALLRSLTIVFLSVAACCSVAILNGLPLVLSDTPTYLVSGISMTVPWDRPIFYGLFERLFLFADLWPVIVVQSGITIYVLWVATRVASTAMTAVHFVVLVIALCLFSTLPWVAGELMPGILAAVSVLGIYIIVFGGPEVSRFERIVILAITTFAISTHLSNIPLFAGMVVVCTLCRWRLYGTRELLRRAGLATAALVVAVAAIVASNVIQFGKPMLARGSGIFAVAKLLESGAAQSYLVEACPEAGFRLCEVAADLPADVNAFLWREGSTVRQIDRPGALFEEASVVALNTLVRFPLPILQHAAISSLQQLLSFTLGGEQDAASLSSLLADVDLGEGFRQAALNSRQAQNALPFAEANLLTGVGLSISFVAIAYYLWSGARPEMLALLATILTGVVMNAVVCGTLSMVDDRYQARIVWLIPFFGLLALFFESWDRLRRRKHDVAAAGSLAWPPRR